MPPPQKYAFPQAQDRRIHDDVRRQLTWQSDIQSKEIEVAVRETKVFLSGCVETCFEKAEAESAANAVYGVTGVVNNIRVVPKRQHSDSEIAADIVAALRTCASVVEELPVVQVVNGVAVLHGRARWEFQRHGAEQLALAIAGVKSVINMIDVDSPRASFHDHETPIISCRPHLVSTKAS